MKRWVVTFDLRKYAASWMFLQFLINAELQKPKGYQLVVDIIGNGQFLVLMGGRSWDQSEKILRHVMLPSLELIGAVPPNQDEACKGKVFPSQYHADAFNAAKLGATIPKFKVPEQHFIEAGMWLDGRNPVIVTLRECNYWSARNSNLEAWKKFARESGEYVIFVRDTAKAHEPLDEFTTCPRASTDILFRAALMAHAKANLMVATGPCVLSYYSDVPFLVFRQLVPEHPEWRPGTAEWWQANGLEVGEQPAWFKREQRLTWCDDSYDNIVAQWANISPTINGALREYAKANDSVQSSQPLSPIS